MGTKRETTGTSLSSAKGFLGTITNKKASRFTSSGPERRLKKIADVLGAADSPGLFGLFQQSKTEDATFLTLARLERKVVPILVKPCLRDFCSTVVTRPPALFRKDSLLEMRVLLILTMD